MQRDLFGTSRPFARLRQGHIDWYRIENKSSDVASVYIYDEIGYVGITASDFVADLNKITAKSIQLHLNTPGGDVFDGITIYNALKDHSASVEAIVDGQAASAGAFILQAADNRVMNQASQVMIHDAWGMAMGNAEVMREMVQRLDEASNNIASIFAERSGQDLKTVRDAMKQETRYNADEAVEFGLADAVKGEDTSKNKYDLSIWGSKIEPATQFNYEQIRDALSGAFK